LTYRRVMTYRLLLLLHSTRHIIVVVVVVVVAVVLLSCSCLHGVDMSSADTCYSLPRGNLSLIPLYTLHILPYCGSAKSVWTLCIVGFSAVAIDPTLTIIILLCNLTQHNTLDFKEASGKHISNRPYQIWHQMLSSSLSTWSTSFILAQEFAESMSCVIFCTIGVFFNYANR
jgi:hypothetical protein